MVPEVGFRGDFNLVANEGKGGNMSRSSSSSLKLASCATQLFSHWPLTESAKPTDAVGQMLCTH